MFPVAVISMFVGYTLIYVAFANQSNGGQGPTVWEALGWGESPTIGPKSYARDLQPNVNPNPQVPATFQQV